MVAFRFGTAGDLRAAAVRRAVEPDFFGMEPVDLDDAVVRRPLAFLVTVPPSSERDGPALALPAGPRDFATFGAFALPAALGRLTDTTRSLAVRRQLRQVACLGMRGHGVIPVAAKERSPSAAGLVSLSPRSVESPAMGLPRQIVKLRVAETSMRLSVTKAREFLRPASRDGTARICPRPSRRNACKCGT